MLVSVIGWLGTVTYLVAYMLLALGVLETGAVYLTMNIAAAGMVMLFSATRASWAALVINGAWCTISLYSQLKLPLRIPQILVPIIRYGIVIALFGAISILSLGNPLYAFGVLAWCSFCSYIFPYLFFLNQKISLTEFHRWNLLAAVIIIPDLVIDHNWPVVVIEVFWSGVALAGLLWK
jgi:hypothetical protein